MSQQPFTEIEPADYAREALVIVQWINPDNDLHCMEMIGNGYCNLPTTWGCKVCSKPTCDFHEATGQGFNGDAICEACGKLSKIEQERIYQFKLELNK